MARFLLADCGTIDSISTRGDVIDLDANDIAAAQLAVDGQIEERQVSPTSFDLKSRSDRPDVFWLQGRFGADQFAFIPGFAAHSFEWVSSFVYHLDTP
jgi:hypothetical protein